MPEIEATALAVRKDSLMTRLDMLHAKRGAAALDGEAFDSRRIADVEAELAALSDAEVAARQRQRAAASAARAARLDALCERIERAERRRLQAVTRAESACRSMVTAMTDIKAAAGEIRAAAGAMGRRSPFSLAADEVEARLADRLVVQLGTVAGRSGWFGRLALRHPFFQSPTDDWTDAERRAVATDIAALTMAAAEG